MLCVQRLHIFCSFAVFILDMPLFEWICSLCERIEDMGHGGRGAGRQQKLHICYKK